MKANNIDKNILFTIHYFDTYQFPPTFFEVWRYLYDSNATIDHVILRLDELIRLGEIESKNGFYFLPGRSHYLEIRQKQYDISEKLWGKAVLATKILSIIPFIKSIIVNNSLARFGADKTSDIDFLIITEKNKIWTVKIFASGLLWILGLKRQGKHIAGQVCLSMFLSNDKMNLEYLAPKEREFFLAYWIAENAPLLDRDKTFQEYKDENKWIKKYLPNSSHVITDYFINLKKPVFSDSLRKIFGFILKPARFEDLFRYIQLVMIKSKQKKLGNPTSVIFNDNLIKFHITNWKRLQTKNWEKIMKDIL